MSIRYGGSSFVKIDETTAKKHVNIDETYWLREFSVLYYLHHYKTDNIIKLNNISFDYVHDPRVDRNLLHSIMGFTKYDKDLFESKGFTLPFL